jgi:hypothetical protein
MTTLSNQRSLPGVYAANACKVGVHGTVPDALLLVVSFFHLLHCVPFDSASCPSYGRAACSMSACSMAAFVKITHSSLCTCTSSTMMLMHRCARASIVAYSIQLCVAAILIEIARQLLVSLLRSCRAAQTTSFDTVAEYKASLGTSLLLSIC